MWNRLASYAVIPAVVVAGALAYYNSERSSGSTATISHGTDAPQAPAGMEPAGDTMPAENGETLPPNHPPIGGATSPGETLPPNHPPIGGATAQQDSLPSGASEAPALAWKVPATWQEAPNPNAMRLATYHAPGGVEVSISRAGGGTEANIQRWIGQFDNTGREGRVEKTVHGLHVVTVDVAGTYVGGGMAMGGGAAEAKPDWALLGAIVESVSPPYFFKMTGPAAAVRAARPAFDRLVDNLTPM